MYGTRILQTLRGLVVLTLCSLAWRNYLWAQAQVDFVPRQDFGVGGRPVSVAAGDFNGDGWQDLATANQAPGSVSILLGEGDGTFQAAKNFSITGAQPNSIAVGDFNGDGRQDLATANTISYKFGSWGSVSILLGNGDGTFQNGWSFMWFRNTNCVAVGDFNADGRPDLVVTNGLVSILLGQGDGTFQNIGDFDLGPYSYAGCPTVGDFNGDGRQDLALDSRFYGGTLSILVGRGDGTFQNARSLDVFASFVTVGDFNADGHQDLVTNAFIFLGSGDGTFQIPWELGAGGNSATVGDFNGDGRRDLAVVNASNGVSILLGRGDGTFRAAKNFGVGGGPVSVAVGDFNGDGRQDLATANSGSNTVSILVNDSAIKVGIDILHQRINPKSHGSISVAILSTHSFDATAVDTTTVRFGANGTEAAPVRVDLRDVDHDGDIDMALSFETQQTGIRCGNTSATLHGKTLTGNSSRVRTLSRPWGVRRNSELIALLNRGGQTWAKAQATV